MVLLLAIRRYPVGNRYPTDAYAVCPNARDRDAWKDSPPESGFYTSLCSVVMIDDI